MKIRLHSSVSTAAAALSLMYLTPIFGQAPGQTPAQPAQGRGAGQAAPAQGRGGGRGAGYQPPEGPTPRVANGKPDFSGFWQRPYTPDMSAGAVNMEGKPYPPENPAARGTVLESANTQAKGGGRGGARVLPFTPTGLQDWKTYDPSNGDYTGACFPFGLMRSINSPDPLQIVQNASFFAELFEQNTWFHLVPIDGRPHVKGAVPTWFGDSVGHWDGDTLVIETVNFNGKTRLDTNGHGHSDQLVLTERWTRPNLGRIDYEMIIHDPKYYTEDWKNVRQFQLRTDQQIMEYSCEENNKALFEGRIKPPKYD